MLDTSRLLSYARRVLNPPGSRGGAGLLRLPLLALVVAGFMSHAFAEEGGTGHHLPGTGVSLTGMLPAQPGLTVGTSNWLYFGDASASRSLGAAIPDSAVNQGISSVFSSIIGGSPLPPRLQEFADLVGDRINARLDATTLDLKIQSVQNVSSLSLLYVAPWDILGGHYAAGVVLPFVAVDTTVTINVNAPRGTRSKQIHDSAFGFSDMVVMPVILGWNAGDFHWNTGVAIYAPTGYYNPDDLAPLGKGFWSFEPFGRFTYLNTKYGQEASIGLTYMFNTTNPQTDYRSGDQINIEWLFAQHLPLGFSVGVTGFYYQQVTADSGGGAKLGSFRAQSIAIGPTIGYTWKTNLAVNAQWFYEIDTSNRFQGNVISVNASWTF